LPFEQEGPGQRHLDINHPWQELLKCTSPTASAGSFTVGALLALLPVLVVPRSALVATVSGGSLLFLALLGAMAARAGGSPVWKSVARVTNGSSLESP